MDLIDASFNRHPDNSYLTSDWHRLDSDRALSEYVHRFYAAEVLAIAESRGYTVIAHFRRQGTIPHSLYVLRRN